MEKKRGVGGEREGKETKEYWEEEGRGEGGTGKQQIDELKINRQCYEV